MNRSDMARYPEAFQWLQRSVWLAEQCGNPRQAAWSLALIGRAHLLRGEPAQADEALDRSLELARAERWTVFLPWPETLRADVDARRGQAGEAAERLQRAFALGCQLGNPCWEAVAARGLGLADARRGCWEAALKWLGEAHTRGTREADRYQWVHGYVLDAMCRVGLAQAAQWAEELAFLAARTGMRELVVRAHLYRGRLGQEGALEAARLLAAEIDNPALDSLLAADPSQAVACLL